MNPVDHKRTAPKLPGVVKNVTSSPRKAPIRASTVVFLVAGATGVAGFFSPAFLVIAAFFALVASILRFGKKRTNMNFHVDREPSMFERELVAGSPEWQIRQIREGSY
ncbi:hypothetical protein QCN27_15865 [Cereibacter sp. SYSU M97828]|nr:hypothetical protein [Cereibacter flavus]